MSSRCIALQAPAGACALRAASASTSRAALPPSTAHRASVAGLRSAAGHASFAVRRCSLSVSAIQVSGPGKGQFDETPEAGTFDPNASKPIIDGMVAKITEQLEAENVNVEDVYGDGRHVNITVVSSQFEGKRSVKRQQMVFQAIWEEMQEKVHAVDSMTTKTPEEASG